MNKIKQLTLALLSVAVLFTSCKDDDDGKPNDPSRIVLEDGATLPETVISGNTLVLSEGFAFNLSAALRVKEGATIEIEPGVKVTAQGGAAVSMFVVVERGATIEAIGTDADPIVFTAADQTPASWGGLIIAGAAPINVGDEATAEIGDVKYGGDVADDNSGTLKYVRVEYTGSQIDEEKQHNGFTFYGVGNGTTIDYIQAYKGADDGIEFFGGTVNVSHVISSGSQDDQFDYAQGWVGKAEYLYLEQLDDATYAQDKGIEGDNLKSDNSAEPFSNPNISRVTIIGYTTNKNGDDEFTDGIRIREGSKGTYDNIVIKNYGDDGVDARSLVTLQNLASGDLTFTNLFVEGVGDDQTTVGLDDGETDPGTVVADAAAALAGGLIGSEPTGADFNSWKGSFAKELK